jgi:hypothetical protein
LSLQCLTCASAFQEATARLERSRDCSLEYSLITSGLRHLSKVVVNKMGTNPRSFGTHAGVLIARFEMFEAAFKLCFHEKVPALCCVWASTGVHDTEKPAWRELPARTPSRMKYRFETMVSMDRWTSVMLMCVPLKRDPSLMMCPLPTGYVNRQVLPSETEVVLGAVIGSKMIDPSPKALGYSAAGLRMGEGGILVGKRYDADIKLFLSVCQVEQR